MGAGLKHRWRVDQNYLLGITAGQWRRLLRENHYAVDAAGIETAFLYPTQGLYMASIGDLPGDFAIAICRAYNEWVQDFCSAAPGRLLPAGMLVGLHDPVLATEEARRLAAEGFRAVFVRPNPIAGRNLDDAAYEPLWAACAEGGMAVAVHEGFGSHLPSAGADRFLGFFSCHTAAHPIEQMLAVLSLIGGGVLERHPTLRVAFLEAGCGWVPYWLWRMDEHWEATRGVAGEPRLPLKPSDYFRRQAWVSCDPEEPDLGRVIDLIGAGRVVFGSDYPHPDHVWPRSVEAIRAIPLSDEARRKILWDNPRALYGLD